MSDKLWIGDKMYIVDEEVAERVEELEKVIADSENNEVLTYFKRAAELEAELAQTRDRIASEFRACERLAKGNDILTTQLDKQRLDNIEMQESVARQGALLIETEERLDEQKHLLSHAETKMSTIQSHSICCRDSNDKCTGCLACCG